MSAVGWQLSPALLRLQVVDAPSLASFIAAINGGATTLIKCFTDLAILAHSASFEVHWRLNNK
jgi:hypothetical protein